MHKLLLSLILIGVLNSNCWAENDTKPLAKLDLQDGDSIVFLGDSITHQCLYTQYVEDFFYTRFPEMRLKIHNAGVGGARAWDALQRFDDDVAAYKPKYVTILLGMNDGTYRPYDEETFQTYRTDMTEVVNRLEAIGAVPILMTPTMFDSRAARMGNRQRDPESTALYNSVLAYYGTWCREVAVERGFGFVDMWSPLNNITLQQRKTDPQFTLIQDAVHPGPSGQVVMATAIVDNLGLQRRVSSIRVSKGVDGKWSSTATGGKLSDLESSDNGLSFKWHAESLPWVLPEEAALGVKLTALGHKLSGEQLEFHGLEPGRYELMIDGTSVGTYSTDQLGRHIELQGNEKTPQYQQALKVAMLNKTRNETSVRSLRNEWGQFQRYARVKREAAANPNDDTKQKELAELSQRMEGLQERVANLRKAAAEQEDEIFSVNQPQVREYTLQKVK